MVNGLMILVVSERVVIFCFTNVCGTLIDTVIRNDITALHILFDIQGVAKN